jgi:hypothetical protein
MPVTGELLKGTVGGHGEGPGGNNCERLQVTSRHARALLKDMIERENRTIEVSAVHVLDRKRTGTTYVTFITFVFVLSVYL